MDWHARTFHILNCDYISSCTIHTCAKKYSVQMQLRIKHQSTHHGTHRSSKQGSENRVGGGGGQLPPQYFVWRGNIIIIKCSVHVDTGQCNPVISAFGWDSSWMEFKLGKENEYNWFVALSTSNQAWRNSAQRFTTYNEDVFDSSSNHCHS